MAMNMSFPNIAECIVFFGALMLGRLLTLERPLKHKGHTIPGPRGYLLIGHMLDLWGPPKEVFKHIAKLCNEYTRMFGLWLGPWVVVLMYDPRDVFNLLGDRRAKKSREYDFLKPWLGESILTSQTSPAYRLHKRLVLPAFNTNTIKDFINVFNTHARMLVKHLAPLANDGPETNIRNYLAQCAMHILLDTQMGVGHETLGSKSVTYSMSVERICELVHLRTYKFWLRPDFIYRFSSIKKEMDAHLNIIHPLTDQIIKRKREEIIQSMKESNETGERESPRRRLVFLDLLIEYAIKAEERHKVNDEDDLYDESLDCNDENNLLSDEQVRNEVLTMMFAGQDTITVSSGFVLSMLGTHPDIQEAVQAEMDMIFPPTDEDPNRAATWDDLQRMELLERVIQETWRMYPPVPIISRTLNEDLELEGCVLPASCSAAVVLMQLHRHRKHYPHPNKFDPERFLPEQCRDRHPHAFLPFGAGPRACIGSKFALVTLKVIISTLMREYTFTSLQPMTSFALQAETTLKRKEGFPLVIRHRNQQNETEVK